MKILLVDSNIVPVHIANDSLAEAMNTIPNEVNLQSSWQDNPYLYIIVGITIGVIAEVIAGLILKLFGIVDIKHRTIIISHKTKEYVSSYKNGSVSFNYSNNNGLFTIGSEKQVFTTCWSKASNTSIHAYSEASDIECIGIMKNVDDLNELKNIDVDFSSRCRTAKIGDVIIWKNIHGQYAATKITKIKDDTRGDDRDLLEFEYVIYK